MLRGRSRWSELGSGAELLDWARTEFWHGNGGRNLFLAHENQWRQQENSGIFPRWGVNARDELLIRPARESTLHFTVYTRGAQCGCVTARKGGEAGTENKCARARMALCGVCVVELALGQPAEPPPTGTNAPRRGETGDLTGGENDTNPVPGLLWAVAESTKVNKSNSNLFSNSSIYLFSICPAKQKCPPFKLKLPHYNHKIN